MSKKTRIFVLASVAILGVGLTTGLLASYMGLPTTVFSRAAGPEELQYVPADAAVVAYADVRSVMSSQFRERFRQLEPDTREKDEFERMTGVNIEQDIHTVVAAVMAGSDLSKGPEGILVIARGRFEPARIEALAIEHGGKIEEYKGKRLLLHAENQSGTPEAALGFLDADLVAIGSYQAVKNSIDASTGKNVVSNTELMRQINDLESSNAWAVGRFDALASNTQLPEELRHHLPAIQWFTAAGHVNGGVSGVFKAEARDDESAQNMREIVRGFLALAKMQANSHPELKGVVDSLQLSGDGKVVALSFTVPTDVLDALEALAESTHREIQR